MLFRLLLNRERGPLIVLIGGALWKLSELWQAYDFLSDKARAAGLNVDALIRDWGWLALMIAGFAWLFVNEQRRARSELKQIIGRTFEDETVLLDGGDFRSCVFRGTCTLRWNGGRFVMSNSKFEGPAFRLESQNGTVTDTIGVLKTLGLLRDDFARDWKDLPAEHFASTQPRR